jgi:hypothetical protein
VTFIGSGSKRGQEVYRIEEKRIDRIFEWCIESFGLDLRDLVVFTEAASGYYLYTPILAAVARARKVYAIAADSRYGSKEEVKKQTEEAALKWDVADRVEIIYDKSKEVVYESDIITNTGFVRPINRQMISWMKPTAVIPLMWETWEFRRGDLDLDACKEYGILVMGTDESKPPLSMYKYCGYLAMKLLFELGLEGHRTKTILLGGRESPGRTIYNHFQKLGMEITWFSNSENDSLPYSRFKEYFMRNGTNYDALIIAEHGDNILLLGKEGLLTYEQIRQVNPALGIGVIAGNLDIEGLNNSSLRYFPNKIQPFGYMSYQPYHLGPLPVLELYAGGLKVAAAMARGRRKGMSIEETKNYALINSPAMDFI